MHFIYIRPPPSVSKKIVLSAEDNDADFRLIEFAIEQANANIELRRVVNGEDALAFLFRLGQYQDAPRPDFILLDWNMPRKNGFEVLEEIKRDDSLQAIPVVMLTSSRNERDRRRAASLGVTEFVTKSSDLDEFIKTLAKHFLGPEHGNHDA
jgi:chemotaxis family two-component system response regulator Rcp1